MSSQSVILGWKHDICLVLGQNGTWENFFLIFHFATTLWNIFFCTGKIVGFFTNQRAPEDHYIGDWVDPSGLFNGTSFLLLLLFFYVDQMSWSRFQNKLQSKQGEIVEGKNKYWRENQTCLNKKIKAEMSIIGFSTYKDATQSPLSCPQHASFFKILILFCFYPHKDSRFLKEQATKGILFKCLLSLRLF